MKLIQWVLDNLFTVLIIGGVLSQLLNAIKGKKAQQDADASGTPRDAQFEDPELAERTRRIREDIRRKIAERQSDAPSAELPPFTSEPELRPEPSAYEPPPLPRSVIAERAPEAVAALQRMDAQRQAEILEQQATMAERMRELETMKAAAQRRAAFEALSVSQANVQRERARGALLDDLRDPQALRRAFVLREVLGPPVALR